MKLASLVAQWDNEYESRQTTVVLDDTERRPFGKMLEGLHEIAPLRFQPYQNDTMLSFMEKLRIWLAQFEAEDQPIAFLVAMKLIFVTQRQLEVLSRRLFEQHIRRRFLEAIIADQGLRPYDFLTAMKFLNKEMDETVFIPNSFSSRLNDFVHVNKSFFAKKAERRLTGPEVAYWVHPSTVAYRSASEQERIVASRFERLATKRNSLLKGKKRLVVLEDFAGTGSDITKTLQSLDITDLGVSEILIGVLMATEEAAGNLKSMCARLSKPGRAYDIEASMILPHSLRCFDGPVQSYLEQNPNMADVSNKLKKISEKVYRTKFFHTLQPEDKHGFGGLALAFAFYTNCPDNALPIIWKSSEDWHALFPRASNII